jgi:ferrochelatase
MKFAVLLMAYGTPRSEEEIEPYLTDIRRGHKPSPGSVKELTERYRKIGGSSPLFEITNAQATALEKILNSTEDSAQVYVGMKHWHPYIGEVVPQILADGSDRIVGIVLAPHYSQISIGGYRAAFDNALQSSTGIRSDFVESWHDNPLFHRAVAEKITSALKQFPTPRKVQIVFTAHSLPERIIQKNDPYPKQLLESCQVVADMPRLENWSFAYQSAGQTNEKWLEPDILEKLDEISKYSSTSGSDVLVVPIGFVADHLEILYDLDIEAQLFAQRHGLTLRRTESLNTSPTFIAALADIVRKKLV